MSATESGNTMVSLSEFRRSPSPSSHTTSAAHNNSKTPLNNIPALYVPTTISTSATKVAEVQMTTERQLPTLYTPITPLVHHQGVEGDAAVANHQSVAGQLLAPQLTGHHATLGSQVPPHPTTHQASQHPQPVPTNPLSYGAVAPLRPISATSMANLSAIGSTHNSFLVNESRSIIPPSYTQANQLQQQQHQSKVNTNTPQPSQSTPTKRSIVPVEAEKQTDPSPIKAAAASANNSIIPAGGTASVQNNSHLLSTQPLVSDLPLSSEFLNLIRPSNDDRRVDGETAVAAAKALAMNISADASVPVRTFDETQATLQQQLSENFKREIKRQEEIDANSQKNNRNILYSTKGNDKGRAGSARPSQPPPPPPPPGASIIVELKVLDGNNERVFWQVPCRLTDSVKTFKSRLIKRSGRFVAMLYFGGKKLDDEQILWDCGVRIDSILATGLGSSLLAKRNAPSNIALHTHPNKPSVLEAAMGQLKTNKSTARSSSLKPQEKISSTTAANMSSGRSHSAASRPAAISSAPAADALKEESGKKLMSEHPEPFLPQQPATNVISPQQQTNAILRPPPTGPILTADISNTKSSLDQPISYDDNRLESWQPTADTLPMTGYQQPQLAADYLGDPILRRYEAFLARERKSHEQQPNPVPAHNNWHAPHSAAAVNGLPPPRVVQPPTAGSSSSSLLPVNLQPNSNAQSILNSSKEELAMLRPEPSRTPYSDELTHQHLFQSQSPPRPEGTHTRPPSAAGLLPAGTLAPFVQLNTSASAVYFAPPSSATLTSPPRTATSGRVGPASSLLPTSKTVLDPVTGLEVPAPMENADPLAMLTFQQREAMFGHEHAVKSFVPPLPSTTKLASAILPSTLGDYSVHPTKVPSDIPQATSAPAAYNYFSQNHAVPRHLAAALTNGEEMAAAAAYGAAYSDESQHAHPLTFPHTNLLPHNFQTQYHSCGGNPMQTESGSQANPRRRITFAEDISNSIAVPTYRDAHIGAPTGMSPLGNSNLPFQHQYLQPINYYPTGTPQLPQQPPLSSTGHIQPSLFYPHPHHVLVDR